MMGGSESGSGDKDGVHTMKIHVPIGWQRRVDDGLVVYVSPSGTALSSLDEVRTYLLTDGTCKCGLECPLVMHKVFNFSQGVKVQHQSQPLGRTEQDMTKLCNHRRKVVAMAALCRSMQASQLPYIANQPEVSSVVMENRGPKRILVEPGEDYRGTYQPKHQLVSVRPNHNLNPATSGSPKCSPQLIYPYNGFSPLTHSSTNSNNSLDALRRLQNPPLPLPATSPGSTTSPFSSYNASQRSPRTPTPHNLSQGQRVTPQTPEIPGSPRLRTLSPLPPSSPVVLSGGGRKGAHANHHPHGVIVSSPLSPSFSPSCSPSPSLNSINCPSPLQRSRHPSASSLLFEHGVGNGGAGGGGMAIGGGGGGGGSCGYPPRRKSSSSPQSPHPAGSPNSPLNCPKYKLEEILEQFKSSGNASTNNHQHLLLPPSSSSLLTNQSNPHNQLSVVLERDGKPSLKAPDPVSSGPAGFGPSSAGLPPGPFLNHSHSHQARQLHPVSFPASSLLSAAAKAQVAQMTQNSSLNSGCLPLNTTSPLELSKEIQQQQSSKVTNSTLHYSHPSTPIPTVRPHPPLAATSTFLFPPSHPLVQSMASSSTPFLPPVMERNASHRKRLRRSPTVLSMLKESQLPNGPRKTLGESSVINLSSTSSYSTSAAQSEYIPNVLGNHHHLLQAQARLASNQTGHQRQTEALDFTTALAVAGFPLNVDTPTQPLSALLHLLSVQNAQASVSAQLGSGPSVAGVGGGGSNRNSPRQSSCSPQPHYNTRPLQTQSPLPCNTNNTLASTAHPLSPSQSRCRQSPSLLGAAESPVQRLSPSSTLSNPHPAHHHSSMSQASSFSPPHLNHIPDMDSISQLPLGQVSLQATATTELDRVISTIGHGHSQSSGSPVTAVASSTSPKPLDLSNHVLALLTATSTLPHGEGSTDSTTGTTTPGQKTTGPQHHQVSIEKKAPGVKSSATSPQNQSPSGGHSSLNAPSNLGDNGSTPLPLAEAFPFMNQEQLLQLLSTTGGLPSLLDPTILASLPLGGLWLQHAQLPGSATPQPLQHLSDQQQLLIEHEEALQQNQEQQQQHKQQSNNHIHHNPLFPLLPFLMGPQGELPLNLLGLMNPLPTPTVPTHSPGQENDLGLAEKTGLQALLMASLLLGQQQAAMLPLSSLGHLSQLNLELPLNQQHQLPATLEGLSLDKTSGLLDLSALPGPGLLEVIQGLLPPLPPAEGPLQALQALLFPGPLPQAPSAFLPLSPALLSAALGSSELQSPHTQQPPTQHTQQPNCQVTSSVTSESGVETLIPLSSLQGKDNHILQQLLLNPTILGDLSTLTSLHSMLGLGAGPLLMPPEQASALGVPLLQGPDGAINLLNNIQLNITNQSEGDKPIILQETNTPSQQEDMPSSRLSTAAVPSPTSARAHTPISQCVGDGPVCSGGVLNPYASFMETIYTSFLQVSAKEEQQAQGTQSGSEDTTTLCALPPSYPGEHPQASAPFSLSPRRACSLRNPDLSRLNMEAAAHSPAQGTPKPSEDGSAPQSKQRVAEGHTHTQPFLEEAKTDSVGLLTDLNETSGGLVEQSRDQMAPSGGLRKGRKRKQTLQNVLEDFRDMDTTTLEDPKPTAVLLKPERSVRGRRRRGTRSQRQ
ncbi:uncharacterized protein mbd6 [Aplochiton taeniatus]